MNLTSENLKRVCHFDTRMVTLDADGIFDLWIKDPIEGKLMFDEELYTELRSIMPNELFEILNRNVKKDL